jgi:hypothetical protein
LARAFDIPSFYNFNAIPSREYGPYMGEHFEISVGYSDYYGVGRFNTIEEVNFIAYDSVRSELTISNRQGRVKANLYELH